MTDTVTSTGKADSALDQLLNDELDKFNATATQKSLRSSNSPSEWSKRKAWSPVSPGGHGGRRLESE